MTYDPNAGGAPTDPSFYTAVISMAQRLSSKPEDLLWIWASETAFNPTLDGGFRTISTLSHAVVDSGLLTQAEWDTLPTLTATQQLPFIERFYKVFTSRYLGGRGYEDAFEAYLGNAAPGLLRPDGQYNLSTTMYGDPNQPAHTGTWRDNWPMDSFPVARQQGASRGVKLTLPFGEQLVSEGLLRGWITLGDLKSFMVRSDVVAIAQAAIQRLRAAQAGTAYVAASDVPYTPDFSKSFGNPQAPVDTRVAPAAPDARPALGLVEYALLGGVIYLALWWMKR